ncbi:hypothetical protein PCO85_04305 [Prodigiosinella aquatilis]|nr:hypothetical protein [Prodigiosinella sp. LS101]WJV54675.1 hypothetical protein PCO85_04305 [Prodigiosinella sp. LS101]WJV59038.1 hypothetical protein PCO84_04320 [Pectobacteriaceae bacterium C111]
MKKQLPKKFLVDTNVPKTANLASSLSTTPEDLLQCALNCVELIESIVKEKNGLVLDYAGEIFNEYRGQLKMKGQPGVGDKFMKWVHDNQWSFPKKDLVTITKNGDSYTEFPEHKGLKDFDISDRKFIAVSVTHDDTPPIYEATDCKWWGWKEALNEVRVRVIFLDEKYIQETYDRKFGNE